MSIIYKLFQKPLTLGDFIDSTVKNNEREIIMMFGKKEKLQDHLGAAPFLLRKYYIVLQNSKRKLNAVKTTCYFLPLRHGENQKDYQRFNDKAKGVYNQLEKSGLDVTICAKVIDDGGQDYYFENIPDLKRAVYALDTIQSRKLDIALLVPITEIDKGEIEKSGLCVRYYSIDKNCWFSIPNNRNRNR